MDQGIHPLQQSKPIDASPGHILTLQEGAIRAFRPNQSCKGKPIPRDAGDVLSSVVMRVGGEERHVAAEGGGDMPGVDPEAGNFTAVAVDGYIVNYGVRFG
ncbi:MAG: hypothetical protein HETSPECPRED_006289 [Heterodermia speciosa]|uniref:Uncharacterized protein n=1 Tax=Heterodermia speciosa TaxID=116794 RepID=A0A8H3ITV5_9LECA|nr:MAG: hypothetical protein HETSPECPRED_006289 [Heterodermia speciosa]